jgi:hypothetical protein
VKCRPREPKSKIEGLKEMKEHINNKFGQNTESLTVKHQQSEGWIIELVCVPEDVISTKLWQRHMS